MDTQDIQPETKRIQDKLAPLLPVFAKAAIGDFSDTVPIPETEDEFTPLYVGVQVMLEVIREQLAKLTRQKNEMNSILNNTPEIIARFDHDLRHIYINDAVERAAGIPAHKYIGKTNKDLGMPEELLKTWDEAIRSVFDTGKERTLEFEFPGPFGNRFFSSLIIPEHDATGSVATVLGITRDVTEFKLAQIESQKLAAIVESSNEAIVSLTLDGTITSWNKGAERMYGYTSGEMIGKSFAVLIPPERPDEKEQILDKIRRGVGLEHYQAVRVKKDGAKIYVSITLSPIRDGSGNITGAAKLSTDISFRKRAEQMLLESTEKIEQEKSKVDAVLASMADGVFAMDTNGVIILMNGVAEKLSGYTVQESLGKRYQEILRLQFEKYPDQPYPPFVEGVIRTGETSSLVNHSVLCTKDGNKISVTYKAGPVKDEKGTVFGCVVVLRDNSRERALEKAKDEFISVAAHQLRTPLGIMRWGMELMLEGKSETLTDSVREKIADLYQSNLRMIALVNDLLNVSRIEQGRVLNEPKDTDVPQAIQSVLSELKTEAEKKSLAVTFQPPDPPVHHIFVDQKRFHEALQNILANAVKYNRDHGSVTVAVTEEGGKVKIAISDTGIGIPPGDQQRIFSKFFRAQNATLSQTDGSGLGLFIVKSYVLNWGGSVWLESPTVRKQTDDGKEEAYGTNIFLTIPFAPEKTEENQ